MYELDEMANTADAISELFLREKRKKMFEMISYDQIIVCIEHTGIYCQPLLDFA